jgi:hypothetical protein
MTDDGWRGGEGERVDAVERCFDTTCGLYSSSLRPIPIPVGSGVHGRPSLSLVLLLVLVLVLLLDALELVHADCAGAARVVVVRLLFATCAVIVVLLVLLAVVEGEVGCEQAEEAELPLDGILLGEYAFERANLVDVDGKGGLSVVELRLEFCKRQNGCEGVDAGPPYTL